MYAALETAKKAPKGSVICAMLPDTGERYLSTPLFADIDADMNEVRTSLLECPCPVSVHHRQCFPCYLRSHCVCDQAELEIAKSTPSFQLIPGEEPVLQK
jgi:cysteine synthase A